MRAKREAEIPVAGMPPALSTASSWALDCILRQVRESLVTQVPELLSLGARALARAPVPDSLSAVTSLSRDDALQLVPVACTACFAVAVLFLHVVRAGSGSARAPLASSYFLARVILLRGMGATYLAGFMTAALEGRAIFGSLGIAPADSRRVRTVPAFRMLALGLGLDFEVRAPPLAPVLSPHPSRSAPLSCRFVCPPRIHHRLVLPRCDHNPIRTHSPYQLTYY